MNLMQSALGGQPPRGSSEAGVIRELLDVIGGATGSAPDISGEGQGSVAALIEALCRSLPSRLAMAVVDHAFGVVPLLTFFEGRSPALEAARLGKGLTSFGVLTANARFSMEVSFTAERSSDGDIDIAGLLQVAMQEAVSSLVLVSMNGERRLCLLPHDLPAVNLATPGPSRSDSRWLDLEQVVVEAVHVSRPVDVAEDSLFDAILEAWAGASSYAAALCSARLLRVLRLAMTRPSVGGLPFNTSQLAAHEITRLEIESGLLLSATEPGGPAPLSLGGFGVLVASTALLRRVILTAGEWADGLGLAPAIEAQGVPVPVATQLPLSRSWMAEGELARRMGLL